MYIMTSVTELIDTHCHIHFPDYALDPQQAIKDAVSDGVTRLICVGCTLSDSQAVIEFAASHENVWASIGLHPHEAKDYVNNDHALQQFHDLADKPKVIAIGEIGLDYFYGHSSYKDQTKLLKFQLDIAAEHNLPVIFHVRGAQNNGSEGFRHVWNDFWQIFDQYKGDHRASNRPIRGVVHSFTGTVAELDEILARGLYVGLNGIMTFTTDAKQLQMAKRVPKDRLLLETDAPFLTPKPFRGTICQPKHVRVTAEFLSELRGESSGSLAAQTTENARTLFNI